MQNCIVCGKATTREKGFPFPTDARFIRYCLHLKLNPKKANKKEGGKIVNVSRMALPRPSRLTLDQLLEKNVGMSTSAAVSSQQNVSVSSNRQSASTSTALSSHTPAGSEVFGSLHNRQNRSVIQSPTDWQGLPRHCQQVQLGHAHASSNASNLTITDDLADAAKKTLVLFRKRNEEYSANDSFVDQKSVIDWLRQSFNLPANAICHVSLPAIAGNCQVVFLLFVNLRTAENILKMCTEQNLQQCILNWAADVLKDGAQFLKQKVDSVGSFSSSSRRHLDVNESFRVLLQPIPGTFGGSVFSDENAWRNLAAAQPPQ
uniref:Uncharacterized protein n=1 Tax=Globodera rostochiensis TaxID=31243 RepID=A0A914GX10_GLORO